jgi:HipA-like protein
MRQVDIFRNHELAGILSEDDEGHFTFRYADGYYTDSAKRAISLTLPKSQQEYRSPVLFPFFMNMLSEGINRKTQSRLLKIDENDHFGLLAATAGSDTIGNITVKPISV